MLPNLQRIAFIITPASMMKTMGIVGVLLVLGISGIRAAKLDSLSNELLKNNISTETRCKIYGEFISSYRTNKKDSSLYFMKELERLSNKENLPIASYYFNFYKGKYFEIFDSSEPSDSIVFYLKNALRYARKTKSNPVLKQVDTYYELSYHYMIYAKGDLAMKYAQQAINIAEKSTNQIAQATAAMCMGSVLYFTKNQFEEALVQYQLADSLFELNKTNAKDQAYIRLNIGHVFLHLNKFDRAEEYYQRALKYYTGQQNEYYINAVSMRLGEVYYQDSLYDKALRYFKPSYTYFTNSNDLIKKIENNYFQSLCYAAKGVTDSALFFGKNCQRLADATQDTTRWITARIALAHAYLSAKKYDLTYKVSKEIYNLSERDEFEKKRLEALRFMYVSQKQLGNNTLAFDYLIEYTSLKDRLGVKRNTEQVTELEKKYQTAQKEKQLALANQQKTFFKKQRWLFAAIAALIGAFIILYKRYINKKKISALQAEMTEVQLASLKSQMNPHFMFNSINSIKGLIINGATTDAADQLTRFSKLMRSTLNYSAEKAILLTEEMEFLSTYSNLERFKGAHPANVIFEVDPSIDPEETSIIPFLIQPFVENAFKHAFHEMDGRTPEINIRFKVQGDYLQIEIEDNGIGVKNEDATAHVSKGTGLVEKRLELHNKKKDNVSINFRGKDKGTLVVFRLK